MERAAKTEKRSDLCVLWLGNTKRLTLLMTILARLSLSDRSSKFCRFVIILELDICVAG